MDGKKINPIEALPRMIDKLCIDESRPKKIANKLARGTASRKEENVKHVRNLRSITIPSYDIDGMTAEELQACLCRITENPQQPFSFLANLSKEFTHDDNHHLSTKAKESLTDIDIQLATVARRIESCQMLLEKAKSDVDNIRRRANLNVRSSDAPMK